MKWLVYNIAAVAGRAVRMGASSVARGTILGLNILIALHDAHELNRAIAVAEVDMAFGARERGQTVIALMIVKRHTLLARGRRLLPPRPCFHHL